MTRRVTVTAVLAALTGVVALESWRLGIAAVCLVALGWIATRVVDGIRRIHTARNSEKGTAPPGV